MLNLDMRRRQPTEVWALFTTFAHGHEAVPMKSSSVGRLTILRTQSIGRMYDHFVSPLPLCIVTTLLTSIIDKEENGSLMYLGSSYQFHHGICASKYGNSGYRQRFWHHIRRTKCSTHIRLFDRLRLRTCCLGPSQRALWAQESEPYYLLSLHHLHYGLCSCSHLARPVDFPLFLRIFREFTHCHCGWYIGGCI